ncbi:MBOAT family protein [Helicobacter muridarum]|nr:MBOAT family protein [Helicobacter muridarum]
MNFFLETIEYIFHKDILTLNIILPLGISFFTITQIAYLVDCYEGVVEERSLINYALFVTFFPHLIAGPILHHAEMMPQFTNKNNKVLNHKNITRGIFIFSIGLFKKVVIADSFSIWANAGFGVVDSGRFLNIFESWATSLSYTFQLYFDFSGYCDMAIGLGLLFNIMLPINFYSPYKSLNITEFWRKWHITLGRFLKSYIYIPLGGNRNDKHNRDTNKDYIDKRRINKYIYTKLKIEHIHNKIFTLRNLFIVACISGVWHGAGIGFIIWGILHGIAMVIHRIYSWWIDSIRDSKDNDAKNNKIRGILISFLDSKIYKILCWIVTFNFINITWVFFRAENLQGALNLLKGMFGIVWVEIPHKARLVPHFLENIYGRNDTLIYIVLAFIMCLGLKNSVEITGKFRVNAMWAIFTMVILYTSVIILIINPYSEFIYFSF